MALAYLTINLDDFTGDDHPPISQYSTITLDPGADHIDEDADVIHVRTIVVSLDQQGKAATANGVPCVDGKVPVVAGVMYAVLAPNVLRDGPHYIPALTAGQVVDLSDYITPGAPLTPDQAAILTARIKALEAAPGSGGGGGSVDSVNGEVGVVVLDAADVGADPAGTAAGLVGALVIPDSPDDIGAATAAQGALADTATQPGDLGTAAASDVGDFATAAQGTLAGTAVQPSALVAAIQTGTLTPTGSLTFTAHPTMSTFVPMSIGVDGLAYGRAGGGLFAIRLNSAGTGQDGAFLDFNGKAEHAGGGKVRWITATTAGYVVVTVAGSTTYVWFSTTWGPLASFTLKATIPFLALDALGIPNPTVARDGSTYLFLAIWTSGDTAKPVWASFDGGATWAKIKDGATATDGGVNNHWHAVAYHARWSRIWLSGGDGVNSWFGYSDNKGVTWQASPTPTDSPIYDGQTYQQPTAMVPFEDRICVGPDRGFFAPGIWEMDPITGRTAPKFIIDATVTSADKQYPVAPFAQSGNEAYVAFPASTSMPIGTRNHTDIAATGDGGRSWHKVATIAWSAADLSGNGIVGPDANGYLYHVGPSGLTRAQRLSWGVTT